MRGMPRGSEIDPMLTCANSLHSRARLQSDRMRMVQQGMDLHFSLAMLKECRHLLGLGVFALAHTFCSPRRPGVPARISRAAFGEQLLRHAQESVNEGAPTPPLLTPPPPRYSHPLPSPFLQASRHNGETCSPPPLLLLGYEWPLMLGEKWRGGPAFSNSLAKSSG